MGSNRRGWEPEEILEKLTQEHGRVARRIISDFEQRLGTVYSSGAVTVQWHGSKFRVDRLAALWPWIVYGGIFYFPPVCFRVDGRVEVPFQRLGGVPLRWNSGPEYRSFRTPFDEEEKRRELRDRLNKVPRINLKTRSLKGRPTFGLLLLDDREIFDKVAEVFDWYVNEIITGKITAFEEPIEIKVKSDLDSLREEEEYFEGTKKQRFANYYERDKNLRAAAVNHHGASCRVCGFNFEEVYGERGKDYIEVHHLQPVSTLGKATKVNPMSDMTVLCSNCHRMIHRKKDHVLTPEELESLLRK